VKFLLDTNICIAIIKRKPPQVLARLFASPPEDVTISAITVAELRFGADKSQLSERNHKAIDNFCVPIGIIDFDYACAAVYGAIRANLATKGTPIGPLDMLIAAQAVGNGLILVTNNEREFRRIKNLKIENWLS
jgi:tRNA(fMet)-specific endonuclease VapC